VGSGTTPPRGRSIVAAALAALCLVAFGEQPVVARTDSITVTLTPVGPPSRPQGLPFTIKAVAANSDPQPARVQVIFTLSQAGGASVDARDWVAKIPGLGSATFRFRLTPSQWFAALGTYDVVPKIDGHVVGGSVSLAVLAPFVVTPVFDDVTEAVGLQTVFPGPNCSRFGTGAAWGDANGDGRLDLYVPDEPGPAQLWVQDSEGHFTDEAAARGVDNGGRVGMGAVFVDYDNDGYPDLYAVNDGVNRLYHNDGTGHFIDVAPQAGVADDGAGPSAAWGDYDNDGYLDLYLVNYTDCNRIAQADKLYHNEGDGTFTDQTALLGPPDVTTGAGFQAAWFDFDGDGDQDLYLANDKLPVGTPGNHLWRNDGPDGKGGWIFTDISAESGTGWSMASMGIGIADFDHDLDLDFAISNIEGNVFARNNGDGTFTDVAKFARVDRPFQFAGNHSITWGLSFHDFNLDGWEDLYVAAGPIYGSSAQPNELFVSDGAGRFLDLSAPSRADDPGLSRGVAFADYDGDGRMDLYVVDQLGSPRLYRNVTPTQGMHWLEVDTVGTTSNRDGCGGRLILTVGGMKLLREVFCGSTSLASGSDPTVQFGLGTSAKATRLVIQWPSGVRQVLRNVAGDQRLVVSEPSS
jgi:hypothetical protein